DWARWIDRERHRRSLRLDAEGANCELEAIRDQAGVDAERAEHHAVGSQNVCQDSAQPHADRSVTHVFGMERNPCVRNGPSRSGAARSMKLGTTCSPWRYDAAARNVLQLANLRQPALLHYASWAAVFPIFAGWSSYPSIAAIPSASGID